jgi:hypothetical protein
MANLPNQSILLLPEKENRKNYFKSVLFLDLQKNENNENKEEKEEKNKFIKDLEDTLKCCICRQYLDNPVSDPSACQHYACKACYEKYFQKKLTMPCPICRRMIRKRKLIKIPIFESIKEILKDVKNSTMDDVNIDLNEKCKVHSLNEIFDICLDCQVKMCPACNEERKKHEKHQLVNYKRYIQLFSFMQNNFVDIKQNIVEREKNIKEYKEIIVLSEQQKKSYLQSLTDIASKIETYYQSNVEKINIIIGKNMETIAKYRSFMANIKSYISSNFKKPYDDIENINDIEKEIKNRIDKMGLKQIDKNEFETMKKNCFPDLVSTSPKKFQISFDKNNLLKISHVKSTIDKEGLFSFGLELSEDKKMVNAYLDIKKFIKNKINNSSYTIFIEFGKNQKIFYLEQVEPQREDLYSYEIDLSIDDLPESKGGELEISLNISSISLK